MKLDLNNLFDSLRCIADFDIALQANATGAQIEAVAEAAVQNTTPRVMAKFVYDVLLYVQQQSESAGADTTQKAERPTGLDFFRLSLGVPIKYRPRAAVRDLPPAVFDQLWGLLVRINQLQEIQQLKRPMTIHWPETESEFSDICEALADATPAGNMWQVLTLLAMNSACDAGVDLEDASYGEE
jgi:hypothetical protein